MLKKDIVYNILSDLIPKIILPIVTLIQIKFIINTYGSDIYGIQTIILELLTFTVLIYSGFNTSYLTKLISNCESINEIKYMYKLLSRLLIILNMIFILLFPLIINSNISYLNLAMYFLILSLPNIVSIFTLPYYIYILSKAKNYKVEYIKGIFNIISILLFIIACILNMPYFISLLIYSITRCISSLIVIKIIKKEYPETKIKAVKTKIDNNVKKDVLNIVATRLSTTLFNSADSIILGIFTSLSVVSLYGVYKVIINGINNILSSLIEPIRGNLAKLINNKENKIQTFKSIEIIYCFVGVFVFIITLLNIEVIMNFIDNNIIEINKYTTFIYTSFIYLFIFYNLYQHQIFLIGKYKESKNISIKTALINVILSIVLIIKFNLLGVLVASLIAYLFDINRKMKLLYTHFNSNGYKKAYMMHIFIISIVFILFNIYKSLNISLVINEMLSSNIINFVLLNIVFSIIIFIIIIAIFYMNNDFRKIVKKI